MPMPLDGIRVVDLTTGQQGPVAGAMLADMGADVFKIEQKGEGDPGRKVRDTPPGKEPFPLSYYFENNNRNKRGVALDIKTRSGRDVVLRLAEASDVFLSNFPMAALKELGFDYLTLSKRNPKLVYALATGRGPKGPDKDKPTSDVTTQFLSGYLSHDSLDGPVPFWGGLSDQQDAILMAFGIAAALIARERTGEGQEIYSSLLGSQINWTSLNIQANIFNGTSPWGMQYDQMSSPFFKMYKTKDHKWMILGFLSETQSWPKLCRAIEREDLEFDPRFDTNEKRTKTNRELMMQLLKDLIAERTLDEWDKLLGATDLGWSPLNDYAAVTTDPQVVENEYVVDFEHPRIGPIQMVGIPFRLLETPGSIRAPAPELGEHTEQVLKEVGEFDSQELSKLKQEGTI